MFAAISTESERIQSADGQLVGCLVDGDVTKTVDVGERVVIVCTKRLPIGVVKCDIRVGKAVTINRADDHDDGGAIMLGQQLHLLLGIFAEHQKGIIVGQFLHRRDGAELISRLHGFPILLIIHNLQMIVFRK